MQLTGIEDPVTDGIMIRLDDIEEGDDVEPCATMVIRLDKTQRATLTEWLVRVTKESEGE